MNTLLIASTLAAALLAGCAQTPAQVAATEPARIVAISSNARTLVPCLMGRLDEMHGGWTVSAREEQDRQRVLIHGGVDAGTIAIISLSAQKAALHFSPNVLMPGTFGDSLEAAIKACDKPK